MPDVADTNPSGITVHRFFVWASATDGYWGSGAAVPPSAGADVDGVALDGYARAGDTISSTFLHSALPGSRAAVEAGAAITAGNLLQTDSSGRAIPQTTGKAVARALGSAFGAGSVVPIVFTSGR